MKKAGLIATAGLVATVSVGALVSEASARGAVRCNNRECNTVAGVTASLEAFSGPLRWGSKVVLMKRKRKRKNHRVHLTSHYYVDGKWAGCDSVSSKGKRGTRAIRWPDLSFGFGVKADVGSDGVSNPRAHGAGQKFKYKGKDIDGVLAIATVSKGSSKKTWTDRSGKLPKLRVDDMSNPRWERYHCNDNTGPVQAQ